MARRTPDALDDDANTRLLTIPHGCKLESFLPDCNDTPEVKTRTPDGSCSHLLYHTDVSEFTKHPLFGTLGKFQLAFSRTRTAVQYYIRTGGAAE